jgi:hypothetical protein
VFTTHRHDDFECPSPRDYVDTKSCLAYEQNPYSTLWVRSGSCHRETSLGYDIYLLSLGYKPTWISDFFMMWQLLDAPILGAAQPYHSQYNLELQCHHQHDSTALLPAWLGIYIAPWPSHLGSAVTSMTQQHWRQHDSASTSPDGQVFSAASSPAWLDSIVTSMTRHLHHITAKSPRQRHR